jgi:hypothetical protein
MLDSDGDWDPDTDSDSENVFPAALSGSYAKAPGFAGGYLLMTALGFSPDTLARCLFVNVIGCDPVPIAIPTFRVGGRLCEILRKIA